jgi:hypothetical protein
MKVLHIVNRILINKNIDHIVAVFESLDHLMEFYGDRYVDQLIDNMSQVDYSSKRVTTAFLLFYSQLPEKFRNEGNLQYLFMQILKKHNYDLSESV